MIIDMPEADLIMAAKNVNELLGTAIDIIYAYTLKPNMMSYAHRYSNNMHGFSEKVVKEALLRMRDAIASSHQIPTDIVYAWAIIFSIFPSPANFCQIIFDSQASRINNQSND